MVRDLPVRTICLILLAALAPLGCTKDATEPGKDLPKVIVQPVEEKPLSENEFFTGRTAPEETVEIRARATGFLTEVKFKDGVEVAKGAELFIIDSAPYKTDFDRYMAEEKRVTELLTEVLEPKYERAKNLGSKVVGREELEKIAGDRLQAYSQVAAAKESSKKAKINLDYCLVKAPIAGRISVAKVTPGNLVTADTTLLTTIVSVDPIYAYFNVDETTVLALQKRMREKKFAENGKDNVEVWLGLANEKKGIEQAYPHKGFIDFVDNKVDATTGTLKVRGVFANPGKDGTRLLTPGMFCRVKVPIGLREKALWVPDKAVVTDLGQNFLYVVNDKKIVEARPVLVYKAEGGMRPIEPLKVVRTKEGSWRLAREDEKGEDSLKAGEHIIVRGVLSVRPGIQVIAEMATSEHKGS